MIPEKLLLPVGILTGNFSTKNQDVGKLYSIHLFHEMQDLATVDKNNNSVHSGNALRVN